MAELLDRNYTISPTRLSTFDLSSVPCPGKKAAAPRGPPITARLQLGDYPLVKIHGFRDGVTRHVFEDDRLSTEDRGDDLNFIHVRHLS